MSALSRHDHDPHCHIFNPSGAALFIQTPGSFLHANLFVRGCIFHNKIYTFMPEALREFMGMESKEFKALVSLLDDDDEQIVTHVREKIMSLGTQIIPFLEE